MLHSHLFQYESLPYEPLPEAASRAAIDSITQFGFDRKAILEEYSFSSPKSTYPVKVNALAFAHSVHRNPAEYASFTIFNAVNGHDDNTLVSLLAESSAPFHLIHRQDSFSFWTSGMRNGQVHPKLVEHLVAYEQLGSVLSNYAVDLKPQRIIDVKRGRDTFTIFSELQPLQLSLWAMEVTGKLLVDHFGSAVSSLRHYRPRVPDAAVTKLAIQTLGALILADTGVLGPEARLNRMSLIQLLSKAHAKFDRYFEPAILADEYYDAVYRTYGLLQQIRYAGFVPDMLSELYAKAYGDKERKALGSYDTPLYLTRRIWETIPVEYLQPEHRIIADITCGWGSFLIAGHERLSHISDMRGLSLRDHLHGNDKEHFIAQLAGLGLLLSTLEDSWHIDNEDALEWKWLNKYQPDIIVGNPPFGADRKKASLVEESIDSNKKVRHEQANKFLECAIERLAPRGYLAMLMPRSFTVSEASPELRKQLLNICDVLELWELPTEIFPAATTRTVVIFAQKKSEEGKRLHSPVRVRTVQPETYRKLKNLDTFTASGLVIDQLAWNELSSRSKDSKNTYMMDYHVILPGYTWRAIRGRSTELQTYAEIIRGAIIGQKPENKRWQDYPFPRQVPWLADARKVMKYPYAIDYTQKTTIIYPNDLEEPRKDKRPLKDKEYLFTNIIEHMKSPAIPKRAISTIPFPASLSEADCHTLTDAVLKLEAEATAGRLESEITKDAHSLIDTILKAAYQLDDATFARLRKIMEWDRKPEITLDPQPDNSKADWHTSGIVEHVDAENGTITLWIDGFDELQTVQISSSMPSWMLRPNIAFLIAIPRKYIKQGCIDSDTPEWGKFRPQPYMYMNEEELLEELANIIHEH